MLSEFIFNVLSLNVHKWVYLSVMIFLASFLLKTTQGRKKVQTRKGRGEGPSVLPGKLRVQAAGEQALLLKAKGEIRISFYVGKEVDSG